MYTSGLWTGWQEVQAVIRMVAPWPPVIEGSGISGKAYRRAGK
jgi:hypothetical protein